MVVDSLPPFLSHAYLFGQPHLYYFLAAHPPPSDSPVDLADTINTSATYTTTTSAFLTMFQHQPHRTIHSQLLWTFFSSYGRGTLTLCVKERHYALTLSKYK